jgi:mannose/cellobiose epimerase-like protein (N-acyl-D-glucosamine 2-epimerase family)
VVDGTRLCYGHAFVLLALSGAHMAGAATREDVEGVWQVFHDKNWISD